MNNVCECCGKKKEQVLTLDKCKYCGKSDEDLKNYNNIIKWN
jgi:hypothetical protein